MLKNVYYGKFYVTCFLPQLKINSYLYEEAKTRVIPILQMEQFIAAKGLLQFT